MLAVATDHDDLAMTLKVVPVVSDVNVFCTRQQPGASSRTVLLHCSYGGPQVLWHVFMSHWLAPQVAQWHAAWLIVERPWSQSQPSTARPSALRHGSHPRPAPTWPHTMLIVVKI